jgi:hypothetical protein
MYIMLTTVCRYPWPGRPGVGSAAMNMPGKLRAISGQVNT